MTATSMSSAVNGSAMTASVREHWAHMLGRDLFRDHTEGSAVRTGKGRDRTDAGGYKRSLPFTISRILGVIGSQSSHWSGGRLIRVPDKDV